MKIGTIINNHWAGDSNPGKYFIYTGIVGEYGTGVYLDNGELKKIKYYKRDIQRSEEFEPIGYCKAFDIMKEDLKKLWK